MKATLLFNRVTPVTAIASLALVIAVPTANAQINYGDFSGNTVTYTDVTESSLTDAIPLYGAPTIAGDTLDFNPVGLGASSENGGIDLTDAQLEFGIVAHDTYAMGSIFFLERGDYTLAGLGTADTYVEITSSVFLDITEVDGVGIDPIKLEGQMVFTPNASGLFELPSDGGVGVIWTGSLTINLDAALQDAGVDYDLGVTKASVNLDNTIVAQSEDGTTALLAKKDLGITVWTVVPEPTSAALLLLGFGAMAWNRRKNVK